LPHLSTSTSERVFGDYLKTAVRPPPSGGGYKAAKIIDVSIVQEYDYPSGFFEDE